MKPKSKILQDFFSSVCSVLRALCAFHWSCQSHYIPECDIKIDLALVIDNSGSIADKNVKNETNHTIEDNYVTLKVRVKPCSHHLKASWVKFCEKVIYFIIKLNILTEFPEVHGWHSWCGRVRNASGRSPILSHSGSGILLWRTFRPGGVEASPWQNAFHRIHN